MFNNSKIQKMPALLLLSLSLFANNAAAVTVFDNFKLTDAGGGPYPGDDFDFGVWPDPEMDPDHLNFDTGMGEGRYNFSISSTDGYTGLVDATYSYDVDMWSESSNANTIGRSSVTGLFDIKGEARTELLSSGSAQYLERELVFSGLRLDTEYEVDLTASFTSVSGDYDAY